MNDTELFDSHCHFDFPGFDSDRAAVWQACKRDGITRLMIPGVEPSQWSKAVEVSKIFDGIYFAAGLHPWWIEKNNGITLEKYLRQQLAHEKCKAIGEFGLDAMIDTQLEEQQKIVDVHLRLASELQLPVIIHCRKLHNELIVQLKKYSLPAGGVIHAFSGSVDLAMHYQELGFYLGIGGTITYERANKTREAVKQIPLEYLLLETDAPDMPVSGFQGQRNSPQKMCLIAQTLAQLREVPVNEIAEQTTQNAKRLFSIM